MGVWEDLGWWLGLGRLSFEFGVCWELARLVAASFIAAIFPIGWSWLLLLRGGFWLSVDLALLGLWHYLYWSILLSNIYKRCQTTKTHTSTSKWLHPKSTGQTPMRIRLPTKPLVNNQRNNSTHSTLQGSARSVICSNKNTSRFLPRPRNKLTPSKSSLSRPDNLVHTESLIKKWERPQIASDKT